MEGGRGQSKDEWHLEVLDNKALQPKSANLCRADLGVGTCKSRNSSGQE